MAWRYRKSYWKRPKRYGWSNSFRYSKPRSSYINRSSGPKTLVQYVTQIIPFNSIQLRTSPMVISTRCPVIWSCDNKVNPSTFNDKIGIFTLNSIQPSLINSASIFAKSCYITIHKSSNQSINIVHSTSLIPYQVFDQQKKQLDLNSQTLRLIMKNTVDNSLNTFNQVGGQRPMKRSTQHKFDFDFTFRTYKDGFRSQQSTLPRLALSDSFILAIPQAQRSDIQRQQFQGQIRVTYKIYIRGGVSNQNLLPINSSWLATLDCPLQQGISFKQYEPVIEQEQMEQQLRRMQINTGSRQVRPRIL